VVGCLLHIPHLQIRRKARCAVPPTAGLSPSSLLSAAFRLAIVGALCRLSICVSCAVSVAPPVCAATRQLAGRRPCNIRGSRLLWDLCFYLKDTSRGSWGLQSAQRQMLSAVAHSGDVLGSLLDHVECFKGNSCHQTACRAQFLDVRCAGCLLAGSCRTLSLRMFVELSGKHPRAQTVVQSSAGPPMGLLQKDDKHNLAPRVAAVAG